MPYHVLLCDEFIHLFMFISFTIMIQPQNDINWEDIIINSLAKSLLKKTHNPYNCIYIFWWYSYLYLMKEKSASKIILVRLWKYYATYLEWNRVLKVFPLCAQMIIKSYWVLKLSKNISKEIISSACLESKTCCLVLMIQKTSHKEQN